jgi:hypothetical protein
LKISKGSDQDCDPRKETCGGGVVHLTDTCLLPYDGDGVLSEAQRQRMCEAKKALDARYPDRPTIIEVPDAADADADADDDIDGIDDVVEDGEANEAADDDAGEEADDVEDAVEVEEEEA